MLVTNGVIVTWNKPNQILTGNAIRIENGLIGEIGPQTSLVERFPYEERLDAEGKLIMPGAICTHTHFYGAFSRGMAIPGSAPKDFPQILEKLWWPLDKSLEPGAIRYSALVSLVDAIRHGTTTLIDHHASPNSIVGSLDILAEAVDQAGVRAALCYEVTDRDGKEKARQGIQENVRFSEWLRREKPANGRIAAHFGLHASLTLTDKTLDECRQAVPEGTGFHVHVAEHPADEYDSISKSGVRVVQRLAKHGILGPATITAHAVHIDLAEALLLKDTGTWVSHQPRSNMNNAVGVAPVESLLRGGIRVCLGNDGFSNAMWEEWKTAYLLHKVWHLDPRRMNGQDLVEIAVYNNAALASTLFGEPAVGVIKKGAHADLILVDYQPFTPLTSENLPWHILFGFNESMITTTMIAGKVLMKDRQLLTLDEKEIAHQASKLAPQVWDEYSRQVEKSQR